MTDRDHEFAQWAAARGPWLQRTAFLMCGHRAHAEDLAQATLVKMYVAWPKISRQDRVDAYARRTLTRVCIDESRRPWRREQATEATPERATGAEASATIDDRLYLLDALRTLPDRQRVAVVLRHWHDLSVEETADAMRCSPSAVKTHTHRGVARLRELLGESVAVRGEM